MTVQSHLMTACFTILIIAGCSTRTQHPPVINPTSASRDTVNKAEPLTWSPVRVANEAHYLVVDTTLISNSTDTVPKEVSYITHTSYVLKTTPHNNFLKLDGQVNSVMMRSTVTPDSSSHNLNFTAVISPDNKLSQLLPAQSASCTGGFEPTVIGIFELIIPTPGTPLTKGSEWTDSVSTRVCHGKIILRQQVVRKFRLLQTLAWQNKPVIHIQSVALLTIENASPDSAGLSGSEIIPLHTRGNGSASADLLLDQQTGQLLERSDKSSLSLTITTSRGTFPFRQQSSSHTEIQH